MTSEGDAQTDHRCSSMRCRCSVASGTSVFSRNHALNNQAKQIRISIQKNAIFFPADGTVCKKEVSHLRKTCYVRFNNSLYSVSSRPSILDSMGCCYSKKISRTPGYEDPVILASETPFTVSECRVAQ